MADNNNANSSTQDNAQGNAQTGQQASQGNAGSAQNNSAPAFDYDKLANLITGAQNAKEDSVLKNYFKQQGLSQEEAAQAIAQFKQQKADSTPDVEKLQKQVLASQQAALQAQIENKALLMAGEIGVDLKTMPYLIKMADLADVVTDGAVSEEKLKEALGEVLKAIPQLKTTASDDVAGFRVGADTGGSTSSGGTSANNQLRAAFGLKPV